MWEGRGAAQRQSPPPPRARLNFLYSPERYLPPASRVLLRTPQGRTHRGVGGRLPKAARSSRRGSKLSGAASPTAIFPGKRPRKRLRRPFPHLLSLLHDLRITLRSPHRLPSIPFPTSKASNCTGTPGSSKQQLLLLLGPFSIPHFPPPHLPTAGEVRAVSSRVLRPTDCRRPPAGQDHSRPRRQFLRPVPHSPDLLPQSTK